MNAKATILALSALLCGAGRAADVLEGDFPTITIGTNSYTNAHLRAYSLTEGSLRHDGGLQKIKLADLPEPARSKFYNPHKAAEAEAAREAQARSAAQAPRSQPYLNGMLYHPFRKVGDRYYNLQRIYQGWLAGPNLSTEERIDFEARMSEGWFIGCEIQEQRPAEHHIGDMNPPFERAFRSPFVIRQITSEGLLVESTVTSPLLPGARARQRAKLVCFLIHYPLADSAAVGQPIKFIAKRAGARRYTDSEEGTRNIQVYDYGTPCAPSELQQDPKSVH